jgi:hypothetical protein
MQPQIILLREGTDTSQGNTEHQKLIPRPPTSEILFLKRCCRRRCVGDKRQGGRLRGECGSVVSGELKLNG